MKAAPRTFTIQLAPDLRTDLEDWAEEEERKLGNLIQRLLAEAVRARKALKKRSR